MELPTFSILLKEELIPQFLHLCSGGWIQATEPSATDALWLWPDPLQARSLASGAHGCSWKHSDWPQQTPSDPTQVICVNLWWESCKGCRYLSLWQNSGSHNTAKRRQPRPIASALPFFGPLPLPQSWCTTGHLVKGWSREMTAWHQGSGLETMTYSPLMVLLGNWWKALKDEGCQSENLLKKW